MALDSSDRIPSALELLSPKKRKEVTRKMEELSRRIAIILVTDPDIDWGEYTKNDSTHWDAALITGHQGKWRTTLKVRGYGGYPEAGKKKTVGDDPGIIMGIRLAEWQYVPLDISDDQIRKRLAGLFAMAKEDALKMQ